MTGMRHFLLKKKPVALMLCLKDSHQVWYPSKLAQACGASYVYVTHWLSQLEADGWVKLERRGRLKVVVPTESGAAVALALDEMTHKIDALARAPLPTAPAAPEQDHLPAPARAEADSAKKEKEAHEPKRTEAKDEKKDKRSEEKDKEDKKDKKGDEKDKDDKKDKRLDEKDKEDKKDKKGEDKEEKKDKKAD